MLRKFQKDPLRYAVELASLSIICNIILLFAVILTWNSYGNIPDDNHISVALTAIEIFLIIVAFAGFWMLRPVVENAACQVSEEVARAETVEQFDLMKPEIRRLAQALVKEEMEEIRNSKHFDSDDNYAIAQAMAEENGGKDV